MTSEWTPPPGTFGLSKIRGFLGFLIALAQMLCGQGSLFTHAFIVLDGGRVLEAMPSGARIVNLEHRMKEVPIAWSWAVPLTDAERADIVRHARTLEGVGYSFLDYLSLLLLHLGWRRERTLRRVRSSGHMICSQLVDETYKRAGVQLFDDGRFPGDVMPSELANLLYDPRWRPAS